MAISILCPTRQRPNDVARLINSAQETAYSAGVLSPRIEFVFYVDDDDDSYMHLAEDCLGVQHIKWVTGKRYSTPMSDMWNKCYEVADGPYYFLAGDDVVFRTHGWEMKFMEAFEQFPDKIAFVHGLDGTAHDEAGHGTHGMIHQNWVDVVGYVTPPYFVMDYIDTWLNEVADKVGRHVQLKDVLTEHMHVGQGKADVDQNYLDRTERGWAANVVELYKDYQEERDQQAADLLRFIRTYPINQGNDI